jgi:hypothetical protein
MKRLKKILQWTGVLLVGLMAIGLVANAIFTWITSTRLERQLAALRAAGEPLTVAELAPKPIPAEENADTYIREAQMDTDAIQDAVCQWVDSQRKEIPDLWLYFGDKWPARETMRKMATAVNAIYAAHPKAIPLLQRAADCPGYEAHLNYRLPPALFIAETLPVIQELRQFSRTLAYRARMLVFDGRCEEAAKMALANLKLARHAYRNPMLVGYLVGLTLQGIAISSANDALQCGEVSKDIRNALDAELALHENLDRFATALKNDRPFGLAYIDVEVGSSLNPKIQSALFGPHIWCLGRGFLNREKLQYLDLTQFFLSRTEHSVPYSKFVRSVEGKQNDFRDGPGGSFPAFSASYQASLRIRAQARCLRILIALQNHAIPGGGGVPKLTDLGLPAEATTDPYNGEPLHIKKLPQGWVVYSVGPNLKDDGGRLDISIWSGDIGVGPPTSERRSPGMKDGESGEKTQRK